MNRSPRLFTAALCAAALLTTGLRAADPDPGLPADANAIVSVNVQQLLESPIIKKYALDQLKTMLKSNDEAQKLLKEVGLDPLADFTRITLVMSAAAGPEKPLAIIKGKFDAAKITAKLEEIAKKDKKLKVTKDGDVTMIEASNDGQDMFAAMPDGTTLLLAQTKSMLTDALKARKAGAAPELKKAIKEMVAAADDKSSLWLAVLPSIADKLPLPDPNIKKQLDSLAGLSGALSVATDVKLELSLVAMDEDAGKTLAGQIEQGLEQAKSVLPIFLGQQEELKPLIELVNSFKSAGKGKAVTIKGALSAEYIEKVMKDK